MHKRSAAQTAVPGKSFEATRQHDSQRTTHLLAGFTAFGLALFFLYATLKLADTGKAPGITLISCAIFAFLAVCSLFCFAQSTKQRG